MNKPKKTTQERAAKGVNETESRAVKTPPPKQIKVQVQQAAESQAQTKKKITQGNDPANHLARMLALERQVRKCETLQELGFGMVNWTYQVVPYFQGVLCERRGVSAVSGVSTVDRNTPFSLSVLALAKKLRHHLQDDKAVQFIRAEVEKNDNISWPENLPDYLIIAPLCSENPAMGDMLLFFRQQEFQRQEIGMLGVLGDSYAHAWQALGGNAKKRDKIFSNTKKKLFLLLFFLTLLLLSILIKVPETVLAPAEIVPLEPMVITSPLKGLIKDIAVEPYHKVKKGDLLFYLDETELKNQLIMAEKGREVVQADYLRAAQKAFADQENKADLEVHRVKVEEKKLEVSYYKEQLSRQKILSPEEGIIIFDDRNEWIGRPIDAGQRVMTLADPHQAEIEILLPVDDAIALEKGSKVKLFLRTDPLHPIDAEIRQTSYRAKELPGGGMVFPLKASFVDKDKVHRIGLQGTAKLYSDSAPLLYYIFRKPLAVIRRNIGF